jgi:protein SCO1/2
MLAACQQGPSEPPPLAGAAIGGPFTLINQQGKPVSDTDFKGKYRMVYFGYTWCPDICPTDMQQLGKAFRAFEAKHPDLASKVQPIFISVDPGRDTPDKIAPFVAAFHPRFIGLTGTPAQIDAVTRAYAIPVLKGDDDGSGNYLVDHGRMTFLMDPDGKPMALLTPDKGADTVTADLEKWVR